MCLNEVEYSPFVKINTLPIEYSNDSIMIISDLNRYFIFLKGSAILSKEHFKLGRFDVMSLICQIYIKSDNSLNLTTKEFHLNDINETFQFDTHMQ